MNVEILIIRGVIGLQIVVFIIAVYKIYQFSNTFHQLDIYIFSFKRFLNRSLPLRSPRVIDNPEKHNFPKIYFVPESSINSSISSSINEYLRSNQKNYTDFYVFKDLVDRNIESEEEIVSSLIPAPLYLGLAATMLGIILGLGSMPDLSTSGNEAETVFNALNPLIDKVQFAMVASVFGLIFTTLLSVVVYNGIPKIVESGKSSFLSFIQSELLPKLPKDETSEIAELNQKLGYFSKNAKEIANRFDKYVEKLEELVDTEYELIDKIQSIDIRKISSTNLAIFDKLSGMMDSFQDFAKYYQALNSSLNNVDSLNKNLAVFVHQTQDVKELFGKVSNTVEKGNEVTTYLNENIDLINLHNGTLQNVLLAQRESLSGVITDADIKLHEGVEELKRSVSTMLQLMKEQVPDYQNDIQQILTEWKNSFVKQAEVHAQLMNEAYTKAHPKFENLEKLYTIDLSLEKIAKRQLEEKPNGINSNTKILEDIAFSVNKLNSHFSESKEVDIKPKVSKGGQDEETNRLLRLIYNRLETNVRQNDNKLLFFVQLSFYSLGMIFILIVLLKEIFNF